MNSEHCKHSPLNNGVPAQAGVLKIHKRIFPLADGPRSIRVWLPPNYDAKRLKPYPVIYAWDGQNLFDHATARYNKAWQLDKHLTMMKCDHVVIGMDSPSEIKDCPLDSEIRRFIEYSAFDWIHPEHGAIHARGSETLNFLTDVVMPEMESLYNIGTNFEHRTLMGSSMGGQMGLYAMCYCPDIFNRIMAFSHATMDSYGGRHLHQYIKQNGISRAIRIYLDMGTEEQTEIATCEDWLTGHRQMVDTLTRLNANFVEQVAKEGVHDETAWSERFSEAYRLML